VTAAAVAMLVCTFLFTLGVPTGADRVPPGAISMRSGAAAVGVSEYVNDGTTRVGGRRATTFPAHSSPRVKVFLGSATLEPRTVEFRGRRYSGWSFVRAVRLTRPYGRGPPAL
jgi:hypothetical protein